MAGFARLNMVRRMETLDFADHNGIADREFAQSRAENLRAWRSLGSCSTPRQWHHFDRPVVCFALQWNSCYDCSAGGCDIALEGNFRTLEAARSNRRGKLSIG
jgi:hypothetical protein